MLLFFCLLYQRLRAIFADWSFLKSSNVNLLSFSIYAGGIVVDLCALSSGFNLGHKLINLSIQSLFGFRLKLLISASKFCSTHLAPSAGSQADSARTTVRWATPKDGVVGTKAEAPATTARRAIDLIIVEIEKSSQLVPSAGSQ